MVQTHQMLPSSLQTMQDLQFGCSWTSKLHPPACRRIRQCCHCPRTLETAGKILSDPREDHILHTKKSKCSMFPMAFFLFPSSPFQMKTVPAGLICGGIFPDRQLDLKCLKEKATRSLKGFSVPLRISVFPTPLFLAEANPGCFRSRWRKVA